MPSRGKSTSKKQLYKTKPVCFFLDECLPHKIAGFLKEVGYPILSWREEFQESGIKDPYLIQYLGAKGYAWITKDDAAKKQHLNEIRTAGISVVWLRGLERNKNTSAKKNDITIKEVHKMLTDKLDNIKEQIQTSKTACYFF